MKTVLPGDHPTLETVPGRFGEIKSAAEEISGENTDNMLSTEITPKEDSEADKQAEAVQEEVNEGGE